ncbi:TonB-linked SusC/RagA family outer membrane protein [Chitinophaga terrae (ex Kim and Jung 2007)]|uniref:TonB-dependent receptor n=1 Tax=Chitinophaga terrae (ex Kim and Jung 2007) TaxID=408074 RepID=UPI00278170E0|nr:TonB-dependent receptor [Chitinophaga terrae (ex Kim and Jung 2007)]MDQ0109761.1 TonB-linked SusC/RagA family outer membrane protein [Chitinophaga terrae (ex Kim and Jung 2007)]
MKKFYRSIPLFIILLLLVVQLKAQHIKQTFVNIHVTDQSLDKIFEQIEATTVFRFVYSPSAIASIGKVSFNRDNVTVEQVLKQVLPRSLAYEQRGKNILVTVRETESIATPTTEGLITGVVTDQKGQPLYGVSIMVKGSGKGVASGVFGTFSIRARSVDTLHFRHLGFYEQEVIAGNSYLKVALKQRMSDLGEVVVVGYGISSKAELTTAIGTVSGEKITDRPTTINLVQGLAGKLAGVSVMTNSGKPGGNPTIKIRGTGSINASNNPLFVIDGIVGADPDIIDPNIIESTDILKDAAATAIYGARGSNGVVVITTKRGANTAAVINFRNTVSFGTLAREISLMNASEALEMFKREYEYKPGRLAPHLDPNKTFERKSDLFNADGTPKYNTNWQKEATRLAISHAHSLSFSGGKDNLTAVANVSFKDQQGILLSSYSKQVNGFINLGWDVKKWFHLQAVLNTGAVRQRNVDINTFGLNGIRQIYEFLPFFPVRYPDGTYSRKGDYPGAEDSENPVRLLKEVQSVFGRTYTMGSLTGTFHLNTKLDFTASITGQTGTTYDFYYSGRDIRGLSETQQGVATRTNAILGSWTSEDYFTYTNHFNKHHLTAVAGASWYYFANTATKAGAEGFFDDFFSYNSLQTGTVKQTPYSYNGNNQMNSFFTRWNYGYNDKYLLGASFRVDGSSRFGKNNKYGYFPAFSAAWRISKENFFNDRIVSDLKLRTSYGVVGNAEIGDYVTISKMNNALGVFNGQPVPSVTLATFGNPNLKWEKSRQLNLGIDATLLDGRVQLTADVYNRLTRDLLYSRQLPATTGYDYILDNIGSISNKGLEITVNSTNIDKPAFSWSTSFNFSMNRSKVLKLNGDIMYTWAGRIMEGQPLNEFFGYQRLGTWGSDEAAEAAVYGKKPGDLKFADLNNNKIKDAGDKTSLGNAMPKFESNIGNTFTYKGLSLYVDLQVMYGHKLANFTRFITESAAPVANSYKSILNAWTPGHQQTYNAALRLPGDGYDNELDSYNIEDGSFLRVRNIALSYRLKPEWLQRYNLKGASIGINAENYFLFTKYSGYDPEATSFDGGLNQGVDVYQYPKPKTISLSLNINF